MKLVDSDIFIDLRRLGLLSIPDPLIAAAALDSGAVLVTRNARDFKKIKDLKVEIPYQ